MTSKISVLALVLFTSIYLRSVKAYKTCNNYSSFLQITCFLSGLSCSMTTTQINSLSGKLLRNLNVLFTDWIIRWAHFPDSSSTWECRAALPDFIGPEYISPVVELSKVFGKILSNNEFCDNYIF